MDNCKCKQESDEINADKKGDISRWKLTTHAQLERGGPWLEMVLTGSQFAVKLFTKKLLDESYSIDMMSIYNLNDLPTADIFGGEKIK
jgi:hypothetical protein